jgi:hypothetical protein
VEPKAPALRADAPKFPNARRARWEAQVKQSPRARRESERNRKCIFKKASEKFAKNWTSELELILAKVDNPFSSARSGRRSFKQISGLKPCHVRA